jgi:hypothetical protein
MQLKATLYLSILFCISSFVWAFWSNGHFPAPPKAFARIAHSSVARPQRTAVLENPRCPLAHRDGGDDQGNLHTVSPYSTSDIVDRFLRAVVQNHPYNIDKKTQALMVEQTVVVADGEAVKVQQEAERQRVLNVVTDLRQWPPPVFLRYKSFDYSSFVGKSDEELKAEIEGMFKFLNYDKSIYKGTLKGRGTGKSTLCEMLRYTCWKKGILPVSVDFSFLEKTDPDWSLLLSDLSPASSDTIYMQSAKFALSLTSRILFDRYNFSSVRKVQERMEANARALWELSFVGGLPELPKALIEQALALVRGKGNGERYERVLVIVDEAASATSLWPLANRTVFSALTAATVHNRHVAGKEGITIFLTSLQLQAFEEGTESIMVPLDVELDPIGIRDKWLKLKFHEDNNALKDKVTRFLAVLAPLPRIIRELATDLVELSKIKPTEARKEGPRALAELYDKAKASFKIHYSVQQAGGLRSVTFKDVHALVFGDNIRLSRSLLSLVANSFLLNNLQVSSASIDENEMVPESSVYVLAQLKLGDCHDEYAGDILKDLRRCSESIIQRLIRETSVEPEKDGHPLEIIYPEWLSVKLNCGMKHAFLNSKVAERAEQVCVFVRIEFAVVCMIRDGSQCGLESC